MQLLANVTQTEINITFVWTIFSHTLDIGEFFASVSDFNIREQFTSAGW